MYNNSLKKQLEKEKGAFKHKLVLGVLLPDVREQPCLLWVEGLVPEGRPGREGMLLRRFEELPSTRGGGGQPKMSWLIHLHLN